MTSTPTFRTLFFKAYLRDLRRWWYWYLLGAAMILAMYCPKEPISNLAAATFWMIFFLFPILRNLLVALIR